MTIEELAFKDYQELKDIQKIDLLLIIEFLQKDRKQWINQYSIAHNDYVDLQRQHQQLKEIEKEHQRTNGELREEIKEYQYIFNAKHKRKLIKKFDKEFSKEYVKKAKEQGKNDIVRAYPDVEEVYRRYYELKDRIDKAVEILKANTHVENIYMGLCVLFETGEYEYEDLSIVVKEMLKGDKE